MQNPLRPKTHAFPLLPLAVFFILPYTPPTPSSLVHRARKVQGLTFRNLAGGGAERRAAWQKQAQYVRSGTRYRSTFPHFCRYDSRGCAVEKSMQSPSLPRHPDAQLFVCSSGPTQGHASVSKLSFQERSSVPATGISSWERVSQSCATRLHCVFCSISLNFEGAAGGDEGEYLPCRDARRGQSTNEIPLCDVQAHQPLTLPEDLCNFLQISNGIQLRWDVKCLGAFPLSLSLSLSLSLYFSLSLSLSLRPLYLSLPIMRCRARKFAIERSVRARKILHREGRQSMRVEKGGREGGTRSI
jgi:hypothetical protein